MESGLRFKPVPVHESGPTSVCRPIEGYFDMSLFLSSGKRLIRHAAIGLGIYRPSLRPQVQVANDFAEFVGDSPIGDDKRFKRMCYTDEVKLLEAQCSIVYTPGGMAWKDNTLHEAWSFREPSIKEMLLRASRRPQMRMSRALLVESSTPASYGDWLSEHLMSIVKVLPLPAPLLLPATLSKRSYVLRDLKRLGIEATFCQQNTLIDDALVVRRSRPSHFFLPEEVHLFRRHFDIADVSPQCGSLLYLSRQGVEGDSFQRSYPSAKIGTIIKQLGGSVLLTAKADLADYIAAADQAETVVADFGSAILNLLYWKTRRLIIVYSPEWLDVAPFFLAKGLGVAQTVLIDYTRYDDASLANELCRVCTTPAPA